MEKIELETIQLPDGQTLVYTTDPSVLLYHIPPLPYGSTGVADMAWMQAVRQVGRNYTDREIKNGWPLAIEPHRLACLQFPPGNEQSDFNAMLVADCERRRLRCTPFERHDYEHLPNGGRELIEAWTDYAIAAPDFAAWLARQGMEPSPHIAAWFKVCKVSTAPAPQPAPAQESKKQRKDLLAPLVEAAQRQTQDPAAVFPLLRSWATEKPPRPPLVGLTTDGSIQWRDSSDKPQELTAQALKKRLARTEKSKAAPARSR